MPFMAIRESDRLDAAMAVGGTTAYLPSKPWDHLWQMAVNTDDGPEARWWYKNFESKTLLVVTGVSPLDRYLDGDATISSSHAEHLATSATATVSAGCGGDVGGGENGQVAAPKTPEHLHTVGLF